MASLYLCPQPRPKPTLNHSPLSHFGKPAPTSYSGPLPTFSTTMAYST